MRRELELVCVQQVDDRVQVGTQVVAQPFAGLQAGAGDECSDHRVAEVVDVQQRGHRGQLLALAQEPDRRLPP